MWVRQRENLRSDELAETADGKHPNRKRRSEKDRRKGKAEQKAGAASRNADNEKISDEIPGHLWRDIAAGDQKSEGRTEGGEGCARYRSAGYVDKG